MLILSRHKNEDVIIGNDVVITVVEIRGDKVRLGIVAPQNVPVHRREVWERIQAPFQDRPEAVAEAVTDVKPKPLAGYVKRTKPESA